jgi:hypothetical protein
LLRFQKDRYSPHESDELCVLPKGTAMIEMVEFLSVHPWIAATGISIVILVAFSAITKVRIF